MTKTLLFFSACLLMTFAAGAQQQKTKVLLLGCFHFDNPGLDIAQFNNVDALSAKRQQEIKKVLDKLIQFKPDKIFVEVPDGMQAKLDSNLQSYKAGKFVLRATETHQLGYRVAKELGLPGLYAVDYNDADFPFDSLVNAATAANQTGLLDYIKSSIDSLQNVFNASIKTETITEMLLDQNSKAMVDFQVGTYFDFLVAGKPGNHVGSYLTSEWWRRNMIIYENILKRMSGKEEKILVIFGSAHTALLQEMMKYNKHFELVPAAAVL
ncbi:MAG: DUF5694 domain-containing protein [Chitinophagaceae bacterium]